ncbi:MAG: GTPase HflX [Treponema sp.]|nr:GTPase HflX [Treponema sp.]
MSAQKHYETREKPKKALLVSILSREKPGGQSVVDELRGLVESLALEIAGHELIYLREKNSKFGLGSGKADELSQKAHDLAADCMVFDWNLDDFSINPSMQRNWEALSGLPAIDRQELIIRIFADRANTREAELQVKLAELIYSLPRLSHKYIDLSRQRGGSYGTKGSGETRLETDRRKVEKEINKLGKEIEEVRKQRRTQRRQRSKNGIPVCAIVGYTNAGKSSLLNALTGSDVPAQDKLFVTLDAVTRRFQPEPCVSVLLTDTVGFIRQLPHSLISAFRSTLEEAALADILIHILDAAEPDIDSNYSTTIAVLEELGAKDIPVITVLNKIDRLAPDGSISLEDIKIRYSGSIAVSAKEKTGLDELRKKIASMTANIKITGNNS